VLDIAGRVKVVKVVKAHFPKEKGYMYGGRGKMGEIWARDLHNLHPSFNFKGLAPRNKRCRGEG